MPATSTMVRRTKAEALATRSRILDAAERLFHEQGVSRTSLHEIAQAAGVTRGAVYWHFEDKGDLFNAMMDRVCLPLEENSPRADAADPQPLHSLREHLLDVLRRVVGDEQVRRSFAIATQKVEYVGELESVRRRHLAVRETHLRTVERALRAAHKRGQLTRRVASRAFALGLHAIVDGLIQNWLLDPAAFDLVKVGRATIDLQFDGLRAVAAVPA